MSVVAGDSVSPARDSRQRARGRLFASALAVCLILASAATAWFDYPVGLPATTLAASPQFLFVVIALESGVGLLLLSRVFVRIGWFVATLLLASVAALFFWCAARDYFAGGVGPNLPGQVAAGCVYLVTACVLAIRYRLLHCAKSAVEQRVSALSPLTVLAIWLALLASLATVMAIRSKAFDSVESAALGSERLVILHPQNWIGGALPIRAYVSPELDLTQGDWTVLLYQHDCPRSEAMLPRYERLAEESNSKSNGAQVALLELPPYAEQPPAAAFARYAKLSDERDWIAQTPLEIQIRGGVVVLTSLALPSVDSPSSN